MTCYDVWYEDNERIVSYTRVNTVITCFKACRPVILASRNKKTTRANKYRKHADPQTNRKSKKKYFRPNRDSCVTQSHTC